MKIILASKSPRRFELLSQIVDGFEVVITDIDENIKRAEPSHYVTELAINKALAASSGKCDCICIGADTTVYMDGEFFDKPEDEDDAKRILKKLSGKTHSVFTGVCVAYGEVFVYGFEESWVEFSNLSDEFIEKYIESKIPLDKAGAYGIQSDFSPVKTYHGNLDNIIGLPLELTKRLLSKIQNMLNNLQN